MRPGARGTIGCLCAHKDEERRKAVALGALRMIPAEKMIALWETDNDMLITRLVILNIDKQPVAASNIPASPAMCNV
jgi:hypothetical protein